MLELCNHHALSTTLPFSRTDLDLLNCGCCNKTQSKLKEVLINGSLSKITYLPEREQEDFYDVELVFLLCDVLEVDNMTTIADAGQS